MKTMLRMSGLAAMILLSNLPTAGAAVGDCHIQCATGATWDGPVSSPSQCCAYFGTLCGYDGTAYTETSFGEAYCPSIGAES
jgi:hypothetical protein